MTWTPAELAVAHGAVTAEDVSGPDPEATVRVTREQVASLRAVSTPPAAPPAAPGRAALLHAPDVLLPPMTSGRPPMTSSKPSMTSGEAAPAAMAATRLYSRDEIPGVRDKAVGAAAVPTGLPPRKRRWPAVLVAVLVLAAAGGAGTVVARDLGLLGAGPAHRSANDTNGNNTDGNDTNGNDSDADPRNSAGEPLQARVVQAVNEANPGTPDAYLSLPGTDYTTGGPFPMVIDSSVRDGDRWKLRVREAQASGAAGTGLGPLWLAPADGAEMFNMVGGRYGIEEFAGSLSTYTEDQKRQVYDVTFDADLTIVKIQQR